MKFAPQEEQVYTESGARLKNVQLSSLQWNPVNAVTKNEVAACINGQDDQISRLESCNDKYIVHRIHISWTTVLINKITGMYNANIVPRVQYWKTTLIISLQYMDLS